MFRCCGFGCLGCFGVHGSRVWVQVIDIWQILSVVFSSFDLLEDDLSWVAGDGRKSESDVEKLERLEN